MKIFDTSSLIAIFSEANCPQVLENCIDRNYKLNITDTVYNELKSNKKTFKKFKKYEEHFNVLIPDEEHVNKLLKRYPNLHRGEVGVICSGLKKDNDGKKYICIVDDGGARNFCENENINMAGLIGFLKWQKDNNDLTQKECEKIYDGLKKSGFRIKEDLLKELIK